MTEALLPSAVSANTSGAILSVVMRDTGPTPGLAACGAAIAPTAAMTAAPRNSEQKIRRNRGVNGETEFDFVIMELAMRIVVVAGIGDPGSLHFILFPGPTQEDAFKQMPGSCQIRMLWGHLFPIKLFGVLSRREIFPF